MARGRGVFVLISALLTTACSDSHGRTGDGAVSAAAVEIGTGCTTFEALPPTGATVEVTLHPRGGYGICTPVRVRGLAEGALLSCEGIDPTTGEVVARPRADEAHPRPVPEGDWLVSSVMSLFDPSLTPADLHGRALVLRATASAADGRELLDERTVTVTAPVDDACAAWSDDILNEWRDIRACTDASECGQDIPIACGCTRNPVARADADISRFMDLLMTRPTRADGSPCPTPSGIPEGSTCDCPEADGYRCSAGVCEWNLLSP